MAYRIIFDFDNCLCRADAMGRDFYDDAFRAVREAGLREWQADEWAAVIHDTWRMPFDAVAKKHGFTPAMRQAGWNVLLNLEVRQPILPYPDTALLREFDCPLYLVTSGFSRLQQSKIDQSGIAGFFAEAYIDAIDKPGRIGKQGIFAEIMRRYGLTPQETIVVGDSEESEIMAGNNLGAQTVQILRDGVMLSARAKYRVVNLSELQDLLRRGI